jgi:hypothetical protein
MTIYGEFAQQLWKATTFSSRLSIFPHRTTQLQPSGFPWYSVFGIFIKIRRYILALVELEQNYKKITWNLHNCMILVVPNVTILLLFTLVTTVTIVPMVTLVHFLPCYLGYQHYPCCYGKCVCLGYKSINIYMVPMVKRTPRTFFALRKIFCFMKNKTRHCSLTVHNRTEVYVTFDDRVTVHRR